MANFVYLNSLNRHIFVIVQDITTKFCTVTHGATLHPTKS